MVYTMTPTVLKEAAPTEEYDLCPRNTKRVLVGHSLGSNLQHRHLPHTLCQKCLLELRGLRNSEIS